LSVASQGPGGILVAQAAAQLGIWRGRSEADVERAPKMAAMAMEKRMRAVSWLVGLEG